VLDREHALDPFEEFWMCVVWWWGKNGMDTGGGGERRLGFDVRVVFAADEEGVQEHFLEYEDGEGVGYGLLPEGLERRG